MKHLQIGNLQIHKNLPGGTESLQAGEAFILCDHGLNMGAASISSGKGNSFTS